MSELPNSAVAPFTAGPLPRRVLHVLNSASGGAALSTLGLITEFRKAGIESSIVCHDGGTEVEKRIIAEAVEGRILFRPLYWWNRKNRAPAWRRPLIELRQWLRTGAGRASTADVVAQARRFGAELIHTNTSVIPEGGRAAQQLRLPHVWHVRELIGPGYPYRFPVEGPAFGAKLARLASLVVANSQATAEAIRPWLPPDLLRVVPNGIDVEAFNAERRSEIDRPLIVGMVASMTSATKKQSLLLEAAARLQSQVAVEFRIYGHPPQGAAHTAWSKRVDELRLTDRFRFAGFVADPVQMMNEIDMLIHTSDSESFGRVIVEAMAARLPVIGVRRGGVAEIVEDEATGLLVEPNDVEALTRSIDRLLNDAQLRRRLGDNGRRRAAAEYDVRSTAERMLAVYAESMARPLTE